MSPLFSTLLEGLFYYFKNFCSNVLWDSSNVKQIFVRVYKTKKLRGLSPIFSKQELRIKSFSASLLQYQNLCNSKKC